MSAPGDHAALHALGERLAAVARALGELPRDLRGGATAADTVLTCGAARMLRFRGESPKRDGLPPLLLVYALVNRPYLLDLEPERSFVRRMLERGRDVYLLDWETPGEGDSDRGLDDYVLHDLDGCVRHLETLHGGPVDLLGVCQGGTLSLCYAALEPDRVRRLALLVTPVDFSVKEFLLVQWMRDVDVERMVQRLGNVPGSLLNAGFMGLRPLSLSTRKSLGLLDVMHDPRALATFARMEQWLADSPDQAGRAFLDFTRIFARENALMNATAYIGPRRVELAALRAPVLNLHATRDHIVPPASSRALSALLPSGQCIEVAVESGHVGVFTSRSAQAVVPGIVGDWFEAD